MNIYIHPAYIVRGYIWRILQANMPDVWDESKYEGLVPIVPLSEEPELNEFNGPHIVYGFADSPTSDLHVRQTGTMSFAIYDQNFRQLTATLTVLREALGRQDETATDLNNYSSSIESSIENQDKPFIGIRFGYVRLGYTEGGTPEDEEGGRQSALLSIIFEYYTDHDIITSAV